MYEANPMAFIVEQAGGAATDGTQRILDLQPKGLHQRVRGGPRLEERGRARHLATTIDGEKGPSSGPFRSPPETFTSGAC